jgi:hypothetical protein
MTDHDDLERRLRGLPLRPPTEALDGRISAGLSDRRRRPVLRWAAAAAVLVAAGVVLRTTGPRRHAPLAGVGAGASPVSVEREVSRTIDDGVVTVAGHVPYRQLRHETVREIWWTDPATGARLWAQLPDEHVSVEPVETF